MKIFIDFDDVLFNTKAFTEDIKKIFSKAGISEELFYETYRDRNDNSKKMDGHFLTYNPSLHFRKIKDKLDINTKMLESDFCALTENTKKYIFSDVPAFLKAFEKKDLFILSFGTNEFQEKKIKNSGISDYFSKIIIVSHGLKSHAIKEIIEKKSIKKDEPVYFLDDRVKFLEEVKVKFPDVITILVKRPEGRYQDTKKEQHCDFEAHSLKEVRKIIEKLA